MIKIKIAAGTAPDSGWMRRATRLLCTHPGSRSGKAIKIREELKNDYPDYSWYISVLDPMVGYATHYSNAALTGFKMWATTCGYKMFIWFKADSQIERISCSSQDISTIEVIVKAADSEGLSSDGVRDEIQRLMNLSGVEWHLIFVNDKVGKSFYAADLYSFCHVAKHVNHDVFVYFK